MAENLELLHRRLEKELGFLGRFLEMLGGR